MKKLNKIILFIPEPVIFEINKKPITKYNFDHGIHQPWVEKIVDDMSLYKELYQLKVWYTDESSMEFGNATWLLINPE